MKNPFLVSALVISVLFNAAGIVFFILFLTEHAHYKSVRKQKASVERTLGIVTSGTKIVEALNSDAIAKCTFASHADGLMDFYAFQAPQYLPDTLDYTLVVYLHGMGSTYLEPFAAAAGQNQSIAYALSRENPRVAILSCNYRKEASWGNDLAIADIIQNIEEVMQKYPFKKIVLAGTSMGGCVALNLAATAPPDIKNKLAGVISSEAAGDLSALWIETKDRQIRPALLMALGGTPEQISHIYRQKSFLNNIDGLPCTARVYLLSCRQDKVVPPELQQAIANALNQHKITNRLVEIDGNHQPPPTEYYAKGLKFVLGNNDM